MAINVLVVDDSGFMRQVVAKVLNKEEDMVVSTARHGKDAIQKVERQHFDVVVLDVEMPIMGGLDALDVIVGKYRRPTIMLSSLTYNGSETTMKALEKGAIGFVPKPSGPMRLGIEKIAQELVDTVRAASTAKVTVPQETRRPPLKRSSAPAGPAGRVSKVIVAIGASTGGPKTVETVLSGIPDDIPAGLIVVQHMPKLFTKSFADRLNRTCELEVREAVEGDRITDGRVLVAPGDYHMKISRQKVVSLNQGPRIQFLRPAIDVTFEDLPACYGKKIVGVILTGMGQDGAEGMKGIFAIGGITIAQDESTSTIYSMPRVVKEIGVAKHVLPVHKIANCIIESVSMLA